MDELAIIIVWLVIVGLGFGVYFWVRHDLRKAKRGKPDQ